MTEDVINSMVKIVEALGATMIMAGIVITLYRVVRVPFMERRPPLAVLQIRLGLGMFLALGLEFLLAADILRTAVAPTWEEIGQLAAIAAIRTGLNYFLGREFIEGEHEITALESARLDVRAAGPPGGRSIAHSPQAESLDTGAKRTKKNPDARPSDRPSCPRSTVEHTGTRSSRQAKNGYWARLGAALKGPAWAVPAAEQPSSSELPPSA
jgi:uncharacterized membrane protein